MSAFPPLAIIDLSFLPAQNYGLFKFYCKAGLLPNARHHYGKNNANPVWTEKVHNEPMVIYSKKITSLDALVAGAKVGIPNYATNGGRALMVLAQAKLITLKEGVGVNATEKDIVANPKNLNIVAMDAAMLPRTLEDAEICVINSNYALEAKLNPVKDSLLMEAKDSPFANVLVVRAADKDKDAIVNWAKPCNLQK